MSVIVSTPYGKLEGFEEDGLNKFYGIPFAKPPVGELRFKNAQEPEPWGGVRQAKAAAKNPMQVLSETKLEIDLDYFSEDCLYLNVWAPKDAKNLPVMVWIPGGGFQCGGAGLGMKNSAPIQNCTKLAAEGNCVLVSFSYRLGPFGWLNLHEYSDKFDNYNGMRDQVAALKWVNKCISAFGGDPNNVTIFGVSAGGTSVAGLLMMPEAHPYFHKAIMESSVMESFFTEEEEHERTQIFLEKMQLDESNIESLKQTSPEDLIKGFIYISAYTFRTYFPTCICGPVIDGKTVTNMPNLLNPKALKDKIVMIGNNSKEGNFYVYDFAWGMTKQERYTRANTAFRNFKPENVDKAYKHYKVPDQEGFADMLRDIWYTAPKLQVAEQLSKETNVYVYQYTYATDNMHKMGYDCCHSAELYPLFDIREGEMQKMTIDQIREGCEEQLELVGKSLRQFWSSFAYTGKPQADIGFDETKVKDEVIGGATVPDEWKPYDKKHRYTMILPQGRLEQDPEKEIRELYDDVRPITHRACIYKKYGK